MEQNKLFKIRDQREKNWFWLDNEYLNGYAKYFGAIGTAIYVSLCRHSNNETQQCFPSIATIASENNIGISTVKKYLKIFQSYKLIDISREKDPLTKRWKNNIYTLLDKSEWIIPTQPIKAKRQKKTSQSHHIAMESQSHSTTEPEPFDAQSQSHRIAHNNTNINNTNNIATQSVAETSQIPSSLINSLIGEFRNVSPNTYQDWYKNKTERKACEKLLEKYPFEKLQSLIEKILPQLNIMPYNSAKAFKPSELLRNFDKIIAKINEIKVKKKLKQQETVDKIGFIKS